MRSATPRWLAFTCAFLVLGVYGRPSFAAEASGKEIYQRALRSTCWILSAQGLRVNSQGSGWVADVGRSLIVTNAHVVQETGSVYVVFPAYDSGKLITDRATYLKKKESAIRATVVHRDVVRDLAVIRAESMPKDTQHLRLSADPLGPGERVHTVGNPGYSEALWVYTSGSVRTEVFTYKNFQINDQQKVEARGFETQSAINPGDSGSPVVNDKGEVVGVNFAINTKSRGITYCIHVSEVKEILGFGPGMVNSPSSGGDSPILVALRLREQAGAAMRKGEYGTAVDLLSVAIRVDPSDYLNYNERGAAYTYLDKDSEAIKDFSKVIALNPKHFVAYRSRGAAQFRLGKHQEAIADFTKAIQLNDKYARAYRGRGDAYTKLGKTKEAQEDYKKAIELEQVSK